MKGPDFAPSATIARLRQRAALLQKTRAFFDARGFLEVDTPVLSRDTVVDRYLEPLEVRLFNDPAMPSEGRCYYLQTSPEFAMKRLLAAGAGAIYQIARAFRAGERGRRHNVEFTLLEWYRPGDDMPAAMEFLSDVCQALLGTAAAERLSYREAFLKYAGVDPFLAPLAELAALGRPYLGDDGREEVAGERDGWLNLLLAERVEGHLGRSRPTILHGYPPSQAALAQVTASDPPVAERFELYVQGVELANGYHELLDAETLRRRAAETNRQRVQEGKRSLPEDSRLATAMEHGLPACSGVALGFDRLVMLATGAAKIDEVIPFPIERA